MRTRQTQRKTISLPGRYFTGRGSPVDVQLGDLSVGGCRFAIGSDPLPLGAPVQIFVEGAGPYRAIVKWVEGGEAGVTFTVPLTDEQFANFRNSHVPGFPAPDSRVHDNSSRDTLASAEAMPKALPQRFC